MHYFWLHSRENGAFSTNNILVTLSIRALTYCSPPASVCLPSTYSSTAFSTHEFVSAARQQAQFKHENEPSKSEVQSTFAEMCFLFPKPLGHTEKSKKLLRPRPLGPFQ